MPRNRPKHYRITLGDAVGAHQRALTFGGRRGIQDIGLVESAIARPYSGYYRSIHKKAAALLHSVASNHGFADGNKRTAFYLFYLFLENSGYELESRSNLQSEEEIEHLIVDVVTRFIDFDELVAWLQKRIRPSR